MSGHRYELISEPVGECSCHRCTCTGCPVCTEPEEAPND